MDGIVIETFGSGNVSLSDDLKKYISTYINEGGVVLNITQCSSGTIRQGLYQSSSILNELGVTPGSDMTTEAAITKLMWLLANSNQNEIGALLSSNLRGELTGE